MADFLPFGDGADEPEAWDYCPEHECHYPPGGDCPDCLADHEGLVEWGPDDRIALGPEPAEDGWYLDLVARAAHPGNDPHNGWRD